MKKLLVCMLTLCCLALAACAPVGGGEQEQPAGSPSASTPPGPTDDRAVVSKSKTIFYGDDNGEVLHNPLMGWSYYGFPEEIIRYGIPDEFDVGIVKCSWDKLEPTQGDFDFDLLDRAIKRLKRDKKMVYLRLYLMPDDVWDIAGYPEWVKSVPDVGEFKKASINNGAYEFYHPDYGNKVYQGLVAAFLNEVAQHYPDGYVDVIDSRAYGLYGEWDSDWGNYWDKTDPNYKVKKQSVLNDIVNIYAHAFGAYEYTKIAINVPSVRYSTQAENEAYEREGAYDTAMKAGFALRFDAVETVYYGDYFYEYLRGKNYPASPVFSESCYGWDPVKLNIESSYVSFCEARANVATFGFYKGNYENAFLRDYDFYTETMKPSSRFENNVIGYRILPSKVEYNREANTGGRIHFSSEWVNVGSGVLYRDYPLALSLADAVGNEVYVAYRDDDFDLTALTKESRPYRYETTFHLPAADVLPAGTYTVRIALVDKLNNNASAIAMPLGENANETRDYAIGSITLK